MLPVSAELPRQTGVTESVYICSVPVRVTESLPKPLRCFHSDEEL